MEDNFNNLSKDELLNRTVIESVIEIKDIEVRERMLAKLESRAKELKVYQNFKRLQKTIQAEIIQSKKQLNSYETEFTNAPVKLKCKNYRCNDLGVVKTDYNQVLMQSVDTVVCSHPILPTERLINVDTNTEKVKLGFYKDKKWQYVIAEKNTLASKNKILQLANTGIEVNESNAKELIIYISELLALNTETIPVNKAITHLGWIEEGFVPYTKDYKFDGGKSFESIFKDVKEKGDIEVWMNTLKDLRKNEVVHFMIASSFASVLIEKLHINPFIVHLWGKSGSGKTVTLIVCMSIWGNPAIGHLVKNLNSTGVGFERLSAFFHNIPFACDELQAVKSKYSNFNELIYQLTQGEGKSRGTVDGEVQEQLKWHNIFLTNGEEPITLETAKAGVKNRVIEIEEDKDIISNGKETVDILLNNYGFGGKIFLDKIPIDEELKCRHDEICNNFKQLGNATKKQINAMATIVLADEIVSKYIFEDKALTTEDCMKFFSKDVDEAERIYNLIVDIFYQNINKFDKDTKTEFWGTYDVIGNEITAFYFIPNVLKKILADNNINFDSVKKELVSKGYIEIAEKGRYTAKKKIEGSSIRCIKFILQKDNDIEKEYVKEMPF